MRISIIILALLIAVNLTGCVKNPYQNTNKHYRVNQEERGVASWYGKKFNHKRTSSGERFNMYAYTAAHKYLPLHSRVQVTNLHNGRQVIVRINDRGPFVHHRDIDLSYAAAKKIGMLGHGTAPIKIKVLRVG